MKGHGWMPMSYASLIKIMADHIIHNAPPGDDASVWNY
jgi:hypothetical protein